MSTRTPVRALILCSLALVCSFAQQTQGPLTNQRIGQLVEAGVTQNEIIRIISSAPNVNFDLRPNSTDELLKAGVSEEIIRAMAARESGTQMPVASAAMPAGTRSDPPPTVTANPPAGTTRSVPAMPASTPRTTAVVAGSYAVAHGGYKLAYDGGSIPNLKTGNGVKLYLDANQIHIVKDGLDVLTLPASAVTEISYGQDVHRRVGAAIGLATVSFGVGALMALTKSKKHFIGVTWDDGTNKGGAAFQADKNDYRGVLAGLEGITGRRAVNSDTMTVKN